jgi:FAD dependent oxidoreductase
MNADVVVIGGGSAGLAAAVESARRGARTILLERLGFAGGMGTASLVHTFCGLYLPGDGPAQIANPGFPEEIEYRMRQLTGQPPVRMGRLWVLMQHPVVFAELADTLLQEAGVQTHFHSEVTGVEETSDGWKIEAICRGGKQTLICRALVDASGDAVVASLTNTKAPMIDSPRLQRPAYVFGIQAGGHPSLGLTVAAQIVEGIRTGALHKAILGLHFRESGRSGEIFGSLDLSGNELGEYDPLDPDCLSQLESSGRRWASSAVNYLRENAAGWQNAYISHWPQRAGIRESRRWQGRAILSGEDIISGKRHADEIALATWPLELRETNRGPKLRYPGNDKPAGIPFGCLRPEGTDRLFVAGRCISCDHEAQASIRVMGTCFATGQAAGRAAAMIAEGIMPEKNLAGIFTTTPV